MTGDSQREFNQPFSRTLIAGDAWSWSIKLCDFPPDSYSLKYFLRGLSSLDLTAVDDGAGGFSIIAAGSDTEALQPGTYAWQMCVFLIADNSRTELQRGTVEVVADIQSQPAGTDGRSWVKQALDNVRAVLTKRAGRIEQEYIIPGAMGGGRQLRLITPKELIELESELEVRYRRELAESGQTGPRENRIRAAFDNPDHHMGVWR